MKTNDSQWLLKCKLNPERYKIFVAPDSVDVIDTEDTDEYDGPKWVYTFENYGVDFIIEILRHVYGCSVEEA